MHKLILTDIDGVVADCTHRLPYAEAKDYDRFYSADAMLLDTVINEGKKFLEAFDYHGSDYVYITGRPEHTRTTTMAWGSLNCGLPRMDKLLMRKDGDYRNSGIVKIELLRDYIIDSYYELNWREKRPRKVKEKLFAELAEKFFSYYSDGVYLIDDDPKNIMAVTSAFPQVIGITFGTKRMPVIEIKD